MLGLAGGWRQSLRSKPGGPVAPLLADALALSLRRALDRLTSPLARAARAFVAARGWRDFGAACLDDYARERLGRSGRWLRDLAALGQGLDNHPVLGSALEGSDGLPPLGRVQALLVVRVARPATLASWVARARELTVRELRAEVARARRQDDGAPPAEREPAHGGAPLSAADEEPDAERILLRLPCPERIRAAFDEVLDLHRAVNGFECTVTSFVEALVAEWAAGARPGTAWVAGDSLGALAPALGWPVPIPAGRGRDPRRGARPHSGPSGAAASPPVASDPELEHAAGSLHRVSRLALAAGSGSPEALDAQLRELTRLEAEIERSFGRLLARMGRERAWSSLGFTGPGQYTEERLGLSSSTGENRLRLQRGLERHRELARACESGWVGQEAALLIVRLFDRRPVDPDLQHQWVERARTATLKRLRDEVRCLTRGADDDSAGGSDRRPPAPPGATEGASDVPGPLDDAAWHASLRRAPGRSRRRLARLAGAEMDRRLSSPWPTAAADSVLALRLPVEVASDFVATVQAAAQQAAAAQAAAADAAGSARAQSRAGGPAFSGSGFAPRLAELFSTRRVPVPAWIGLLSLLEDYAGTWDDPRAQPRKGAQRIYVRDGWRCMAPGCTSRSRLEEHHVRYRSRGGGHAAANRVCLCRFHHQQGEHGGLACCRGRAPLGLIWRMGRRRPDGRPLGGSWRNERKLDVAEVPAGAGG